MPVRVDGVSELSAALATQALRLADPQPALDASDAALAAIRAAHPTWNVPPSFVHETCERIERYVTGGEDGG